MILVEPELGLANRLRVISSFAVLAKRVGRPFAVSWAPSRGWSDEDLGDLFENSIARVTPEDFERLNADALRLHQVVELEKSSGAPTSRWVDASFDDLFDLEKWPVVTYRGFNAVTRLVPAMALGRLFPSFKVDYANEVRSLRPVRDIQKSIDRVVGGFGKHTVGVHIRRGDAWTSRSLGKHFQRSTDDAFVAAMDREILGDPDVTFFLATDSAETEECFRARYGSALITNSEKEFVASIPGKPKANQRDAVVDLFALAHTRRILGNFYSSFSKFAAVLGGIEREDVVEGSDPQTVVRSLRSKQPCDTVASFAVNGRGLGHASRLVAVHDELRREGALESTIFGRHETELMSDYGFEQVVLPHYSNQMMELAGALKLPSPSYVRSPGHDLAQAIVEMTLRGKRPIILHDVFIHRAVYQAAVAAGWRQALIFRPRMGIEDPAEWLRTVAPAVSVVFVLGQPDYDERDQDVYLVGVEDVVRPLLGEQSLWDDNSTAELRIVVTAGGGGHADSEAFVNAAIAAVDTVSRRSDRSVEARIVTGPYYRGEVRFPTLSPAEITLTRYLPPTHSLYAGTSVVVSQAGYNTIHELESSGVPCVLVPLAQRVGSDDQRRRAEAHGVREGVYVADPDPNDIAMGIEAVMASSPSSSPVSSGRPLGAWQIATMLEALAGV